MIRFLHRWPGLLAGALLILLAVSGAVLSLFPALDRLSAPPMAEPALSVADLADRVLAAHPGLEQIRRAPSGQITAWWFTDGVAGSAVIDPATGQGFASADPVAGERWLTNLHRSLFLGDAGRVVAALGAAALLGLSTTGLALLVRRMGGWRRILAPVRGAGPRRWHIEIARASVGGLILSSTTGLWMTASVFDLLPGGAAAPPPPAAVSGVTGSPVASLAALRETPVSTLRELTFLYPGDATDIFTLTTDAGTGAVDQGTGTLLSWTDLTAWERASEIVVMLHTGQGAAALGLFLGLVALGVPAMAGTGVAVWAAARRGRLRIRPNSAPGQADTVILVGSEGGSTWGFAATLHAALVAAGQKVHVAPMSEFDAGRHAHVGQIVLLAATYGDGDAPASARGFLDRLRALPEPPSAPVAILGFGGRSFPAFCAYADEVAQVAEAKGWPMLLPLERVDRQSPQDFGRWGQAFGAAIGILLELDHQPIAPRSHVLTLVARRDYGAEVQAPTAILRFAVPPASPWQRLTGRAFPRFAAGDLLGILPEGSARPRFYSLASGHRDGFVEICVRKHPGGLCSGQLLDLRPGEAVRAFLRHNPDFRPRRGRAPVILIGAGTGIGPLAGFPRANGSGRPMHLFFGARHPESDFLYADELATWQREGRLASVTTAFSRKAGRAYVQDALRRDTDRVAYLIEAGAQVMVCGGREMAAGVAAALDEITAPLGLTPVQLKVEGRYAEDVY